MKTQKILLGLVLMLTAISHPVANAATTSGPVLKAEGDFEGRHYQVYEAQGISWNDANDAANGTIYNDISGHLATITADDEDIYVDALRRNAGLQKPEAWIGGRQQDGAAEPGQGWMWINSEGPISTAQAPLPSYSNWLPNEPNDQNTEKHLAIGLGNQFGWNDEQALGNIGGFIVEFDNAVPVDPVACVTGNGCTTTEGQSVSFPPAALQQDPQIGIRTYEFMDDMVNRCGKVPLVLFANDGVMNNEVTIPPYLCGSPRFLLVEVQSSGIEVLDGTVVIENEIGDALPGNLYDCTGPFNPMSQADLLDPQHRDKVTYQTTDPARMLETTMGAIADPMYAGSLGEVTFECGSSRGKTWSLSYFGVGLSINFGVGYDLETNPDANFDAFSRLTRYKLDLLSASVLESEQALSGSFLQRLSYYSLRGLSGLAIRLHDRGNYGAALRTITLFEYLASVINYNAIANENYSGEHQMRAGNIKFMYTDSILPFAQ